MPLSSIFEQTEELLEEILRTIREESEQSHSVLCEPDRKKFVDEEEILRKQLKETVESESNSRQWRMLIAWPSPQAAKCLKDAQELRQRVKESINEKLRTTLTGNTPREIPSDRSRDSSNQRQIWPGPTRNGSLPSPGPLSPNPAVMPSISGRTQQVDKVVSPIVKEGLSRQAQGQRGLRCSEEYEYVTKTNCVDINGSNVDGMTFNNGESKNSGAVIHETALPRPVPQF